MATRFTSFDEIADGIKAIWRTGVQLHAARDLFAERNGYKSYAELKAANFHVMPSGIDHLHTMHLVDGKLVER